MKVQSFHQKKSDAKKEVKKLKALGIETTIIPGASTLGKKYKFFVVTQDKPKEGDKVEEKESMFDRADRLAKEYFG